MSNWKLTARQAEVMNLITAGLCNKAMAAHLGVGLKTIDAHVMKAIKAMAAKSRAHAAVLWDRHQREPAAAAGCEGRYAWTDKGMVPHRCGAWMLATDGVTPTLTTTDKEN